MIPMDLRVLPNSAVFLLGPIGRPRYFWVVRHTTKPLTAAPQQPVARRRVVGPFAVLKGRGFRRAVKASNQSRLWPLRGCVFQAEPLPDFTVDSSECPCC